MPAFCTGCAELAGWEENVGPFAPLGMDIGQNINKIVKCLVSIHPNVEFGDGPGEKTRCCVTETKSPSPSFGLVAILERCCFYG
jgi:hypothetical protein